MATQMLECMVAIGGDPLNIVHRGPTNPVSYAEMLVLQYLHGDEAVSDAFGVSQDERDNAAELERLRLTYGAVAIQDVFPGTKPRLPVGDTRIKTRKAPTPPKRKPVPSRADTDEGSPDLDSLRVGE